MCGYGRTKWLHTNSANISIDVTFLADTRIVKNSLTSFFSELGNKFIDWLKEAPEVGMVATRVEVEGVLPITMVGPSARAWLGPFTTRSRAWLDLWTASCQAPPSLGVEAAVPAVVLQDVDLTMSRPLIRVPVTLATPTVAATAVEEVLVAVAAVVEAMDHVDHLVLDQGPAPQ